MNLHDTLLQYSQSGMYPMHMPGHKRNKEIFEKISSEISSEFSSEFSPEFSMGNPYLIDVTEVEGLDNLHHPTGILQDFMEQMQKRYGTEKTYLLVNGSTGGILSAVSACCRRGDTILMARNCHRSVYHAVYLLGLHPIYVLPEEEEGIPLEIRSEQVREALRHAPEQKKPSCVIVTSPTYEGIVSDIADIAKAAHENNIPLIVDEAHGAHFAWSDGMPSAAMEQGADLVVESLHKTLPALTQTALLHLCSKRITPEQVERYLAIYQTSSPSYVLMAGAAQCMDWLTLHGKEAFLQYEKRLDWFREKAADWQTLSLWSHPRQEPSKLVVRTGTQEMTGVQLADRLRQQDKIEVEMAAGDYVLAMTSPCDTEEGFERLYEALTRIDKELTVDKRNAGRQEIERPSERESIARQEAPKIRKTAYEAMNGSCETVELEKSLGKISAEYAIVYPPGIPFLVPGEEISRNVIQRLQECRKKKQELLGLSKIREGKLQVCTEEGAETAGHQSGGESNG